MKYFTHYLLVLLYLCNCSAVLAQPDFKEKERSITVIERGIKLHDEEKYEEAISEFKKIHRNDSNYYLASVEIINSYLALEKNEEGIALCDELLKIKNQYTPNILVFKGDFLDHLKKYKEAMQVYEKGAKDYPLNHSFYYEMGICKLNQMKYEEAYDFFVKSAKLNPFHSSSHLQLGLLAYRNNNITAAMLAYQFSFLGEGTSKRAQGMIVKLEKMVKLEREPDTIITMKAFETENDFSELESIIKSKVALSDKYKPKTDLKFDLIKQMQVVIENIGKYKEVKGFYNEFYGKFFAELQNQKFFEPYAYFMLRGMELENVNKWLEKNKSATEKFENWGYNYICTTLANYPENFNGNMVAVPHWFSNNLISGAGLKNAQEENEGNWNFYFSRGIKKSEGQFVNGKRTGVWKFYNETGGIKEEDLYENGEEKLYKSFYQNTNAWTEAKILNGKIDEYKKTYFSNGNIAQTYIYKDGVINGQETHYYRNGSNRYFIQNTKGILSGDLTDHFDNGKIYEKVTFVNDNREGPAKTFWNNKDNTIESEGVYLKNKAVGEWKVYYRSGAILKQYSYNNDGQLEGVLKEFYENGKLETEEFYSNGKRNGLTKNYTDDGILWQEFFYKKGKLLEYRAFKKDGTKICDNKINGKNFQVMLYHPNGMRKREGKVSDGELEGIWKDYSVFGVLTTEANYKEGEFDGKYYEYHANGKVKTERTYKNGTEDGYHKSFYINGTLETEGMILGDKNEGYWRNYREDGSLESNTYYYDDDRDGWDEFYDVNGKLSTENLNKEGCLVKVVYHDTSGAVIQNIDLPGGNGTITRETSDGKMLLKKQFVKDYAEGASKTFYPDGKIETQVEYKSGKREGKGTSYNPLNILMSEVTYFNNQKSGKERDYSDRGKLESEYNFENGDFNGLCFSYFENGKIFRQLNFDYGDAEGESNMYDDAGELVYQRIFHNNLLLSYTYKDTKGQLLKPMELGPGDTKLVCYFQNGKKSFDATYTNGDLNGKRIVYYSNGKVMSENEYYFDNQHGLGKEYYSSGALKSTENYFYGRRHGKEENYYENGKLESEKNYRCGEQHGWFKYYNTAGLLVKSVLYYDGDPILVK